MTNDNLPGWAKDRLEEEAAMGGSFDAPAERTGFLIGTLLSLALTLLWWGLVLVAVSAVIYLIGKALVGS